MCHGIFEHGSERLYFCSHSDWVFLMLEKQPTEMYDFLFACSFDQDDTNILCYSCNSYESIYYASVNSVLIHVHNSSVRET